MREKLEPRFDCCIITGVELTPNTAVRLVGKTHRSRSHLANFGDRWTVKHPTGSKHDGVFLVADGPLFEAIWLDEKEFSIEPINREEVLT